MENSTYLSYPLLDVSRKIIKESEWVFRKFSKKLKATSERDRNSLYCGRGVMASLLTFRSTRQMNSHGNTTIKIGNSGKSFSDS